MTKIKEGQKVCINIEAKLESGETVLKTDTEKPMEIKLGDGIIPSPIENALTDMKEGESKTITLKPNDSFGPKKDELIIEVPKNSFGSDKEVNVGSRVVMNSPDGRKFIGTVLQIKDEKIKLDFNHPLAGKTLIFNVTVVSVS